MVKPWEKVRSEMRGEYRVFRVREDVSTSPTDGSDHSFYVIEAADWVNIIPVTPDGQIVFVRQYRHGTEEVTLEIPGGIIDAEDPSPGAAGRREMVEETGYDSEQIIYLGAVAPNPAIMHNRCHSYLALDARPVGPQDLDHAEDISVTLVDPDDVPGLIVRGEINHALVVAGFYLYDHYRREAER